MKQGVQINMIKYISLLRGINVSGQKKINMKDLKDLYENLDFKNVTTYIQSGNVIFQFKKIDSKILCSQIEKKIFDKYKFEVKVLIRTFEDLKNVIDNNPFLKEKNIDFERIYVAFLSVKPEKDFLDKIKDLDFRPDRFLYTDEEIYIYCPNGFGRTKINNNFFENKLKLIATTRNLKTLKELMSIAERIK